VVKALTSSERALSALKSWKNTSVVKASVGDTERAQGFLAQPIDHRQNVGATLWRERALCVAPALVRAARQ
jgi:hypothetical protein